MVLRLVPPVRFVPLVVRLPRWPILPTVPMTVNIVVVATRKPTMVDTSVSKLTTELPRLTDRFGMFGVLFAMNETSGRTMPAIRVPIMVANVLLTTMLIVTLTMPFSPTNLVNLVTTFPPLLPVTRVLTRFGFRDFPTTRDRSVSGKCSRCLSTAAPRIVSRMRTGSMPWFTLGACFIVP